jgi:hypothetical protein
MVSFAISLFSLKYGSDIIFLPGALLYIAQFVAEYVGENKGVFIAERYTTMLFIAGSFAKSWFDALAVGVTIAVEGTDADEGEAEAIGSSKFSKVLENVIAYVAIMTAANTKMASVIAMVFLPCTILNSSAIIMAMRNNSSTLDMICTPL